MTYAEAQESLEALARSLGLSAVEGRSLSSLLSAILTASNPPTELCAGSIFDEALRVALGIDP